MRRASSRGMSLAELLVAVALSAVVLLAGTWLLVMLLRQAAVELGREPAYGGAGERALEQVSRDARTARSAPEAQDGWEADGHTLLLDQGGSRLVIIHRDGDRLLRTELPGPGEPERTRVLAKRVIGVNFRLTGSLFQLSLGLEPGRYHRCLVLGRNLGKVPPSPEELD